MKRYLTAGGIGFLLFYSIVYAPWKLAAVAAAIIGFYAGRKWEQRYGGDDR